MKKQEYAIVDIETTGGNATHSSITEIAIIIHDGEKIIDQWESLVNPQKEIPPTIVALTGITNELIGNAPVFDMISDTVLGLLTDRIFVAHNVNFDYSFVRHELEQSGLKWTAKKLCTVRAARKIKPGITSYSLGRLCDSLNIPLDNRHRAGGDAAATAILFSRLLEWDTEGEIPKMIKKTAPDQRLPPNLPPEDFEQLPEKPGVYYFYNEQKKVIYIGKAVDLKKRVASHFSGHKITPQRQNFLRDIHAISFEVCATELMALLLEGSEIKKLWPVYNKALKRFEPKFGLFEYEARNGYRYLAIAKMAKNQNCIESFSSLYEGILMLQEVSSRFEIDQRFCIYGHTNQGESSSEIKADSLPDLMQHNDKIQIALDYYRANQPSYIIMDKGRTSDEKSCVWIEKGHFYGMGYVPADASITAFLEIKEYLTRYSSNHYFMQVITTFAKKAPNKLKLIEIDS
ncbi:exonuclease domain-containing protein [Flavobacterium sp. 7A]|uniref:exonuclease domain-containing protein n=1 Tax=Flavobacterium sp. 7A TaxID=2940571 RepID=UPI0022267A2F|nr:exonuclease domain-containing protein [Flavobacterium sp. 7A]MCW2121034.1 DNA polymerase-3 subunit epsilon [Flavobacterium sp. 7A]